MFIYYFFEWVQTMANVTDFLGIGSLSPPRVPSSE